MHFQIFIPKTRDMWPELSEVGLGDLAPNAHHVELATGPGNVAGRLFSWPTVEHPQNNYLPGSEWIPAAADGERPAGRYLVGIRTDSPPTPGDLARERQYDGDDILLGDGNRWLIPAACQLPQAMTLQPDGRIALTVRQQFEDFWKRSEQWFRWYIGYREGLDFSDADLWHYAIESLGLNYRIVPELVSHLGLIGTDTFREIIKATVDGYKLAEVREYQKKTGEVSTPAT